MNFPARIETAASAKHDAIVAKLVERLLEKHNRFRVRLNAERAESGIEAAPLSEVKHLEVAHHEGSRWSYVTIEIGRIGDEGTLLAAIGRDYRHIAIGERGGLSLLNSKFTKKATGWFNVVHAVAK